MTEEDCFVQSLPLALAIAQHRFLVTPDSSPSRIFVEVKAGLLFMSVCLGHANVAGRWHPSHNNAQIQIDLTNSQPDQGAVILTPHISTVMGR